MIYTFYTFAEHGSGGRWYAVMNYCIHAIMYTYFALRAIRLPMPSFFRISVTSLQILQMVIGLVVSIGVYVIKYSGGDCHQSYLSAVAAILMYGSYLILFANFFRQQYLVPPIKKSRDKMSNFSVEEVKKLH